MIGIVELNIKNHALKGNRQFGCSWEGSFKNHTVILKFVKLRF
jgi:hypothetical protein